MRKCRPAEATRKLSAHGAVHEQGKQRRLRVDQAQRVAWAHEEDGDQPRDVLDESWGITSGPALFAGPDARSRRNLGNRRAAEGWLGAAPRQGEDMKAKSAQGPPDLVKSTRHVAQSTKGFTLRHA